MSTHAKDIMKTIVCILVLACSACGGGPVASADGPAPHSAYVCTGGDAGDPSGCLAAFVGERDSSCSFSCDNGTCQVYEPDGTTVGECVAPGVCD